MTFVTRLAAAVVGTRVASAAGKYGVVGTAAGLAVTSAILRWPGKALMLGAGYGAVKLWKKQNALPLLEDHSGAEANSDAAADEHPVSQTLTDQL